MDAFFASIEQRDFSELKGKPVAVGSAENRGVVAAASYEARKFGVHSALPSVTAIKRCPNLIFKPPRFDVYKAVSKQIMAIFYQYTDLVEPLSIDEAYLDVTDNKTGCKSATLIAQEIKLKIKAATELTASAGVSYNKFLAKLASDQRKPDGLYVIEPHQANDFLMHLPIRKFYGIGEKTAEKMRRMGIYNGHDLISLSKDKLIQEFGKAGPFFYDVVRGIDNRVVQPHRERKSIGTENTFRRDLTTKDEIFSNLIDVIDDFWERVQRTGKSGRTITLKLKYFDFEQITRSKTISESIVSKDEVIQICNELINQTESNKPVRLIGVSLSNIVNQNEPLNEKTYWEQLIIPFKQIEIKDED